MKKNIAIVSGGDSGEYEISIKSGFIVEKYLDKEKYNTYPVVIRGNEWYHRCSHNNEYEIDKNDFSLPMIGEKVKFDCVFIAIHGTPGEDGKLQGYLDMVGIPYTSSDHVTSALTFNKHFTKLVIQNMGVKTARSLMIQKSDPFTPIEILKTLHLPLFIKPNNGGSSVGMSRVNKSEDLGAAISKAFKEDDQILVEEFIRGREITCGVFKSRGEIVPLPVTEVISKKEYFDFEAKYNPALSEEIVPANIPEKTYAECQQRSVVLYRQLNCKGVVRFDYIFNDEGLYFLEVNTVPGLTEASIVPKMARSHGLPLDQLFGLLVEEALQVGQGSTER
jgi:D-alanine-D-alanine ligase